LNDVRFNYSTVLYTNFIDFFEKVTVI